MEEAMIEAAKQLPAAFMVVLVTYLFLKDRTKESANHRAAAQQRRNIAEKQEAARLEAETARYERLETVISKNTEVMGAVLEQLRKD